MPTCLKCGYDLSALPLAQVCPECGTSSRPSLPTGSTLAFTRVGLLCLLIGLPAQAIIESHAGVSSALPAAGIPGAWIYSATATLLGAVVLFVLAHDRSHWKRVVIIVALLGVAAAIEQAAESQLQGVQNRWYPFMRWPHFLIHWSGAIVFGPFTAAVAGLAMSPLARTTGERGLVWIGRIRPLWLPLAIAWTIALIAAYIANDQINLDDQARRTIPAVIPPGGYRIPNEPAWVPTAREIIYWSALLKSLLLVASGLILWVQAILLSCILIMPRRAPE